MGLSAVKIKDVDPFIIAEEALEFRYKFPPESSEKLSKYSEKNVFVIGSERTISNNVMNEI